MLVVLVLKFAFVLDNGSECVAPTISAPTISVWIKNVVGVKITNHNSWRVRVETYGIHKTMKKKEDAERYAYEYFHSNPDKGWFEVHVDANRVRGDHG